MNRDAEAAALTCGSLFLQQFRLSFGSLPEIPAVLFRYRKRHGRCRPRRTSSCPPAPDMFCYYPDIFPPRTECDTLPSRRDAHGTGAHRPVKSLLLQRVSPFRKAFAFQQFFCLCVCLTIVHVLVFVIFPLSISTVVSHSAAMSSRLWLARRIRFSFLF